MYRQTLRLLTVLCLLGAAPVFTAQVSADSGSLTSTVTSVAAMTGPSRQPSSSVRPSPRPAQRQWQGNPARKGYDDFRNKHHLRPEVRAVTTEDVRRRKLAHAALDPRFSTRGRVPALQDDP